MVIYRRFFLMHILLDTVEKKKRNKERYFLLSYRLHSEHSVWYLQKKKTSFYCSIPIPAFVHQYPLLFFPPFFSPYPAPHCYHRSAKISNNTKNCNLTIIIHHLSTFFPFFQLLLFFNNLLFFLVRCQKKKKSKQHFTVIERHSTANK